jgi:hypothetical protein
LLFGCITIGQPDKYHEKEYIYRPMLLCMEENVHVVHETQSTSKIWTFTPTFKLTIIYWFRHFVREVVHVYIFFICSLFNDAFSISDFTASNERLIVSNELGRMWKEAVVA